MSDDAMPQPTDGQNPPGDSAIAAWLATHGLAEHAPLFARERIGLDVLGDLTDADLRALGVAAWGDRRRILNAAAAALRSPADKPRGDASQAGAPASASEAGVAERRQLTVMFCDLVGSTDLAAAIDPEDYRALLLCFHEAVARAASAYDGHVAQLLGDGALVYFGHPVAHEDDAIRAVHAARALVAQVSAIPLPAAGPMPGPQRLRVRVGLATGLVVLGEIGGGALPTETSASGSTPNLAARLQAHAEPDGILVAQSCRELLGEHFELAAIAALTVKGYAAPVRAWRVLGEREAATRYTLLRGVNAAPLIGREAERALLEHRAAPVIEGEGRALLLVGEAGLGKSRLCAVLIERLRARGFVSLVLQTSPHFTDTALHPLAGALRRAMAIEATPDADLSTAAGIRWRVPPALTHEHANRVCAWLDAQSGLRELSPLQSDQRSRLLESLCEWVLAMAADAPLVILLEDLHWIDASSEDWVARLVARLPRGRLLLLMTARPEYDARGLEAARVERLALGRLDRAESVAMVRAAARETTLAPAMVEAIVSRADGNPLFLEELTRAVSAGSLDAGSSAVPATLGDSLTARLDRVPRHKPLVRMAAAIGREFSEPVLAAALGRPAADVAADLRALAETDIVVRDELAGSWMFRHALLRDAAYASLLRAGRASAHRAVAQALMAVDADSAGRRPELLARHHQEAGETVVARELWMRAGDRSAREAGFREAAAHYRAALRLLGTEAPTTQRDIVELRLQNRLGHMLAQGEGYASAPMLDCFVRSRTLALRMNDLETFTAASAGVGGVLLAQGRPDEVEALFEAPAGTDPSALSSNNRLTRDAILAITMSLRGDQRRAWPLMQAARAGLLAEWSGAGSPVGLAFRLVNLLAHAAYSALCQGRFIEADALTHEALERALETKHGVACAYALGARAAVLADMGRASEGQSLAQRALDLALTHDLKPWITLARLGLGLIANDRGEIDEDGLARHRASLDDWRHEQGAFHCGEFCAQMAERLLRAGRARQAEDYVALGESIFRDLSERVYAAELLRLRGHLQELEGDWVEAERQYREAIELADRQGADRLALRAAASLSRLWLAQGQPERVPVFLAPRLENSLMPRSNPEWLSARELFERARAAP